jgi:uncharacterized protein YbaR (Trm112 family)
LFIELTEILRCPRDHPESYLVAAPMAMDGRRIVRGAVGCPECRAEYPIVDGVVHFGVVEARPAPPSPAYDAEGLAALLYLGGPGGYAVLAGAAARLAPALVAAVPGVHFVAVNAPPGVASGPMLSLLLSPGRLPFRTASVRGVALGAGHAAEPWLSEAARILLPGLRLVVEDERAEPAGVTASARGAGMFVGIRDR